MQHSKPRIKDLGDLTGDVLVFGGPYSNLQATEALFAEAARCEIPPGARICTGDAVAYCGNPVETLRLLDGQCEWLAGNTEKQLGAQADDCGCGFEDGSACDLLSRGWYRIADAALSEAERRRMAECPDVLIFNHAGLRYAVIHGGHTDISRFIWPTSDTNVLQEEIAALELDVGKIDAVLCGHSGIPFERHIDDIRWINAGAIGMPPHDGRQETRYVILTENGPRIERLTYDVEMAVQTMMSSGLTQGYERALKSGIWPSEDVLPTEMRR